MEMRELHHLQAGLIMMYKILNGAICVNLENYTYLSFYQRKYYKTINIM